MIELRGVVPPTLTPLNREREVDADSVARLTEHLVGAGVSGLFVLGSSGEGPALGRQQRIDAVTAFVRAARGRVPVLAGVPDTGAEPGLDTLADVTAAGADAVVLGTPRYYTGAGDAHVAAHLRTLAEATDLPVVLYNIPQLAGSAISPQVLTDLTTLPHVIGIKDSGAHWPSWQALRDAADAAGIAALQGAESLIARSVLGGAGGAIPGIANLHPRLAVRLVVAAERGDEESARRLQERLDAACRVYTAGFWLTSLKTAAAELGLCPPYTARALPPLDDAQLARLRGLLKEGEGDE